MGRNVRNLIGTLLLATAIAVTQIPVSDVEAVETTSASDFKMSGTTLVKYNGTAEDVSISNYVEKIEADAFAGNDTVKRVTIGNSVESIGAGAFSECSNLRSVTIPDSVKSIGNAAFSGCPLLSKVTIGTGLSELGNGAFAGCYSLAAIDLDSSNPKFTCDDGAVYNKAKNGRDTLYQVLAGRKGDTYSMPSGIKQIKPYAFWGDYNLENVSISSNVKEISGYAFSNCRNLKEVQIPYSVNNIDMKAFEDCVRLREIVIPPSVNSIHATAFDGCTKLEIQAEAGSAARTYADSLVLEDFDVSEHEDAPIPSADKDSVSDNDSDEQESIQAPVDYYHEVSHINAMEEEENASVKGKSRIIGQEVYVIVDNARATVNVGDTGDILGGDPADSTEQNTDTVPGLEGSEDAKGGSFPKYSLVDNTVIAAQAYYKDEMTSYQIPDGIIRIGEFAFARSGLTSVSIPEGVEEIDYAAFYHCDNLTDVVIPDSVQEIAVSAFAKTPWLTDWKERGNETRGSSEAQDNGSDFLIVGDGILLAYRGDDSTVVIPDNVRQIGAEAFRDCDSLQRVQIPDSVEIIGEAAFAGCGNLTELEGAENVREIRDRAFMDCPISTVRIPASVEKIGLRAFDSADTAKASDNGVIVFEGETLPALSYETAATKLYRDTYRDLAFKGNAVAVVPEQVTDLSGTVLAADQAGFNGVICKMTKEAAENEDGALEIVGRLGQGTSPAAGDTYQIDGQRYLLTEGTETLDNTAARESDGRAGITVTVNSYSIPKDGIVSAVMEGNEEGYLLHIEDSEDAGTAIGAVYKKLYGNKLPHNLCAYDISMTEANTGIPITGLGKQRVEVTIPLPDGIGEDNLHVVCLDTDGQLEEVEKRIVSVDGMDALAFTAKHFSAYGIYNFGSGSNPSVADVEDGQAVFVSLGNKDESPDTGDHSIHPKWFLGAGLFFASMAVFFYRGGRKKRRAFRR